MSDKAPLLEPARLRRFALALLFAQLLAALVLVVGSEGVSTPGGGRLGGDFPAFYAAGLAALQGKALYDPAVQARLQAPFVGAGGQAILFPYPPPVALLFVPLALLPFKLAFVVHTSLMMLASVVGVGLLSRCVPGLRAHAHLAMIIALAFPPLFRASFGGQNTGLTLLLLVGIIAASRGAASALTPSGRPLQAGVLLALSCFKPHYGVVLLGLTGTTWGASGLRRVGVAFAATLSGIYLLGVPLFGADWPLGYLRTLSDFARIDQQADLARSLAPGALLPPPLHWLSAAVFFGVAALLWRRARSVEQRLAVGALALLTVPPHVGWYDVGLLAVPLLGVGTRSPGLALALGAIATLAVLPEPPWVGVLTAVVGVALGLAARAVLQAPRDAELQQV